MKISAGGPTTSPSVHNIATVIADRIQTGRYRDGQWLPAERMLVEEFGVSRTTIRKAMDLLEQRSLIQRSPCCRPVVRSHNGGGGIDTLGTRRRNLGVWIWPGPANPVSASIVQSIYGALDHDAYRIVVGHPMGADWPAVLESEAQFLDRMASDQDIAGVLLWYLGGDTNLPALQRVRAAGIPVVFLDRQPPADFVADYVGVDNRYSAERLVRHLIERGHRRIAHITNMDTASTVTERLDGYKDALSGAGIAFDPSLILTETAPRGEDTGEVFAEIADRLMSMPDRPTALFAVNDILALRLLAEFKERGVSVPDQMAVAGFDGIERWMVSGRSLTTADQPFERMGARALELLLNRIEIDPDTPFRHVVLDAPVSVHESTGSPVCNPVTLS